MEIITSISKCILITFLTLYLISELTLAVAQVRGPNDMNLSEACALTRNRQVCTDVFALHYNNGSHVSPVVWARRSVDVAIWDLQALNLSLVGVRDNDPDLTSDEKRAIRGCIKDSAAILVDVRNSLQILKGVNSGRFGAEISDVRRWLRSAIRTENTCTARMSKAGNGEVVAAFAFMVATSSELIDNALALNKYLAKVGMSHTPKS